MKGNGGTYKITAINTGAAFLSLEYIANSPGGPLEVDDQCLLINLGPATGSGGGSYETGEYYTNVVNDLGIDNTGQTDRCSCC